jgi:hypothetical protein
VARNYGWQLTGIGCVLLLCCGVAGGTLGSFGLAFWASIAAGERTQRQANLHGVGYAYQEYCDARKKAPASPAELRQECGHRDLRLLEDGSIVLLYGVLPSEMGEAGPRYTVLAYEKEVPTKGGYVLFGALHVDYFESADFAKLTKAEKKKS